MNHELIEVFLRNATLSLSALTTEDIEGYINAISRNNSLYDAMGPIVDPTEYRSALHSGRINSARVQLDIARKLLDIRRLMDTLEGDAQ